MSDAKGSSEAGWPIAFSELRPTMHDIIRYGFGGMCAVVMSVIFAKFDANEFATKLGPVLAPLAVFSIGALSYVISRNTAVPLVGRIAECIYACFRNSKFKTRFQYFKEEFKLGFLEAEDAFHVVREHRNEDNSPLWPAELQNQFYRQHSEIHMIYLIGLQFFVFATFIGFSDEFDGKKFWVPFAFSIFSFGVAGFADILCSRRECAQLIRNQNKIPDILKRCGICKDGDGS